MSTWKPIRKIVAAAAAALLGNAGALTLYLTGEINARAALAAGLTALVPVVAGYLVPEGGPRLAGGTPIDPDPGEAGDH